MEFLTIFWVLTIYIIDDDFNDFGPNNTKEVKNGH